MNRTIPLLLGGVLLAACSDTTQAPELGATSPDPLAVSVMARNVYIGADVDAVMAALADDDPSNDVDALMTALGTLQATHFPTRAGAIADEIARYRPNVVGFNEITEIFVSGDLLTQILGEETDDIYVPFLPILQAALDARGLNYVVGGQILNIDAAPYGGAIQIRDYDVVMYDADRVHWQTVVAKNFDDNLGQVAEGIVLNRGWIWGVAKVGANTVNVVVTHPESGGDGIPDHPLAGLRYLQMSEIAEELGDANPVLLLGDLNDIVGSPMYGVLAGAGFTDVWPALRPADEGNTCCHPYALNNETAELYKRIDYVFARGMEHPGRGYPKSWIAMTGADPAERVQGPFYPIWASDHAGLVAEFFTPPANGVRRK